MPQNISAFCFRNFSVFHIRSVFIRESHEWASPVLFCSHPWLFMFADPVNCDIKAPLLYPDRKINFTLQFFKLPAREFSIARDGCQCNLFALYGKAIRISFLD